MNARFINNPEQSGNVRIATDAPVMFFLRFRHISVDHLVDFLKSFAIELRLV
jgi:hypothetical protein